MEELKIYITGRIRGIDNYKEYFDKVERFLRAQFPNAIIVNPTKEVKPSQDEVADFKAAFKLLQECNAIYVGVGFTDGVYAEFYYAKRCGYTILSTNAEDETVVLQSYKEQ